MDRLKQKILNIFKKNCLAGLATVTPEGKPWVRYVTLVAVPDFPLIFCTDIASRKVRDIRHNPQVHLNCGNLKPPDESAYLQIQGIASISRNPELKTGYWNPEWTRYFQGPEDPNYVIIEVDPYRIEIYGPESFEPQVWKRNR